MAIKKYTNNLGTFYHASTYLGKDEAGKEIRPHKRGFKTKKAAQDWIDTIRVNGLEEKPVVETFKDVYEEWFCNYKLSVQPSTYFKAEEAYTLHILPLLGHKKIGSISRSTCQSLANQWATQFVDNKRLFNRLSRIFKYAVNLDYIKENPCDKVIIPKSQVEVKEKNKYFTPEELSTFLQACQTYDIAYIYPLFLLLSFTGLRRQEVLALEWENIDFTNSKIQVNQALTYDQNKQLVPGKTKTQASFRTITADQETLQALKVWKLQCKTKRIFDISINAPLYHMKKILQNLNLDHLTIHGLRHSHCTHLIHAGINIKDVQYRMGHKDVRTTLQIYAHAKKDDSGVVEALKKYMKSS